MDRMSPPLAPSRRRRPRLPAPVAAAFAALLAVAPIVSGCAIPDPLPRNRPAPAEFTRRGDGGELTAIREVMDVIRDHYVKDVPDRELTKDALKGMLSGLDPHSAYMDAKEYSDLRAQTRGEFGGIGAELTRDGGRVKVIAPIDDTPAARAGVRPGDVIQRVGGEPVDGLDLTDVVEKIRGPAGSTVRLTLVRGTAEAPFDIELTRAVIEVNPVKARLEAGRIGYVRISVFNEHTQQRLVTAIERLKREAGGRLSGFVLDLRNDPGGLLDQAVAVAGDFLDGGVIVSTRGRDGRLTRRISAPSDATDRLDGAPMVVLINGASASASEIVAGALQDRGRATIMGTRSFGKGSVQTILPIVTTRGAVRLTTDLYYTPSGRSIQAEGITPDQIVAVPKDQQVPGSGAQLTHEADLKGAIKPPVPSPGRAAHEAAVRGSTGTAVEAAAAEGLVDPTILGTDRDRQLAVAVDALRKGRVSADRGGNRTAARTALPAATTAAD
jgi:carboxyl-terminal processing protease